MSNYSKNYSDKDAPEVKAPISDAIERVGSGGEGGGAVTVDSSLSTTSTNPVQNKVVTGAINEVKDEVEDIRVGADGTTYASAGAAVRGQVGDVKSQIDLSDINVIDGSVTLKSNVFVNGTYNGSSFTTVNARRIRTNIGIKVNKGSKITIIPNTQSVEYDLFDRVAYTGDLNADYVRTYSSSWITNEQEILVPNDKYVFFILKNTSETALTPSDLTAVITVKNSYAYMLGEQLANYSEKAIFRVKPNWTDGFKVGSTGYKNASEGSSLTTFYPIKAGEVIRYDLKYDNASTWFIAFYTSTAYTPANFVPANSVKSINGIKKGTYIAPADGYVVFVSKADYSSKITFLNYIPDYVYNEKEYIPAYWDDHLSEKIATIRQNALDIGENIVDFIFITDAHWNMNAKHSPQIINKLSKILRMRDVVFGGDIITGTQSSRELALAEVYGFYDLFENGINLISTIGNHDLNNNSGSSAALTINEAYPLYIKSAETFAITDKATMGAVYDNQSQNTRVIQFLHPTSSYSDPDVTSWLQAKINEKNNWTIILISHAYWNSKPAGTDLTVNNASLILGKMIADILASTGNSGFWLCGHTHRDYNAVIESESGNSLAIICTTTDAYMHSGSDGGAEMTIGTNTEQAFDVVQIDTTNKKIYMTRIGAGSDREFAY